ncbi:hypothetical protein [Paludibacter jiangxiensis]|uniref:Uncharacterized protein n=1 Tax=Paludibacter jiangxiensis TaxID=681398 RepID=A0A170ZDL4_9BACT|nr:hypothetical protein [Paludibacter jiangxiensis]GAT62561.1 hypothetical protein PJIAN_2120 [Paludibacter jiangxiensis]
MNTCVVCFWLVFFVLLAVYVYLDLKHDLLRDQSTAARKPWSFARTQLAWWTLIIMSAFVAVLIKCNTAPHLTSSALILLGISAATATGARLIDISDMKQEDISVRHQDIASEGFLIDLISNQNGASIHRLQALIFNLVYGVWMIVEVVNNLNNGVACDLIIPNMDANALILLGISSGTYAVLKTPENKVAPNAVSQDKPAPDQSGQSVPPSV